MTQLTLGNLDFRNKKKRLRREVFLEEMNGAIPWKPFLKALRKHYRENIENGRPSYPGELMLRIYFMQQWFQLSDTRQRGAVS